MAEGSAANVEGIKPSRLEEIAMLKEREPLLDERGDSQDGTTPLIYRASSVLRDLKPEHYEGFVISLGLFDRCSWVEFSGRTKEKDLFKVDVLTAFLADLGKRPEDWVEISASVVDDPMAMARLYQRSPCLNTDLSRDVIQSALALDSIFVTSFLLYLSRSPLDKLCFMERTFTCLTRESSQILTFLALDILKMENQIPLLLIRNVIDMIVLTRGENVPHLSERTDEILRMLCHKRAARWAEYLPSHLIASHPAGNLQFSECERASTSGVRRGRGRIGSLECQHLLHCVAEEFSIGAAALASHNMSIEMEGLQGESRIPPHTSDSIRGISQIHRQAQNFMKCLRASTDLTETAMERGEGKRLRGNLNSLPTIEELHKRGVKFKRQDVFFPNFKPNKLARWKATLFLPKIQRINDWTEIVWRNQVAFESNFRRSKQELTQFLCFMDQMIDTERDVLLLLRGKNAVILDNGLGDNKAVAALFNSITTNVGCTYDERWMSLTEDINKYYHNSLGSNIAEFEEQYCSKPWLVCSVIAAVVLLILTLLQTFYTMWAYYHPS